MRTEKNPGNIDIQQHLQHTPLSGPLFGQDTTPYLALHVGRRGSAHAAAPGAQQRQAAVEDELDAGKLRVDHGLEPVAVTSVEDDEERLAEDGLAVAAGLERLYFEMFFKRWGRGGIVGGLREGIGGSRWASQAGTDSICDDAESNQALNQTIS